LMFYYPVYRHAIGWVLLYIHFSNLLTKLHWKICDSRQETAKDAFAST